MRAPTVENPYSLTISIIRKLRVNDRSRLTKPLYKRSAKTQSWVYTEKVGRGDKSVSFWLRFYDTDANAYAGKFRFGFTQGKAGEPYTFNKFYREKDLLSENHLLAQELFLQKVRSLIDEGTLSF